MSLSTERSLACASRIWTLHPEAPSHQTFKGKACLYGSRPTGSAPPQPAPLWLPGKVPVEGKLDQARKFKNPWTKCHPANENTDESAFSAESNSSHNPELHRCLELRGLRRCHQPRCPGGQEMYELLEQAFKVGTMIRFVESQVIRVILATMRVKADQQRMSHRAIRLQTAVVEACRNHCLP